MSSESHNPTPGMLPSNDALFDIPAPIIPAAELTPMQKARRDREIGAVAMDGRATGYESEPDVSGAMHKLSHAITMLGKSNEAEGIEYLTTTKFGRRTLKQRFGKNAWRVEGLSEGGADGYEKQARTAYAAAVYTLTGNRLATDDPWLLDGYRRFYSHYAQVGRMGQKTRSVAQGKLTKGIESQEPELPINHYFNVDNRIYADSWSHGNRNWSEVVSAYTKGLEVARSPHDQTVDITQIEAQLTDATSDASLLRNTEGKLFIENPSAYMRKIASNVKKAHFERWEATKRTGEKYPVAAFLESKQSARAHVSEELHKRISGAEEKKRDINDQYHALAAVRVLIRSDTDTKPRQDYSVTDTTFSLVGDVIRDASKAIGAYKEYDQAETDALADMLSRRFLQPDGQYAQELTRVLQQYIYAKHEALSGYIGQLNDTLAQYAE